MAKAKQQSPVEGAQFVRYFGPLLHALRGLGGSGSPEFYSKHFPKTELFVVNSIRVENGAARGGSLLRYCRWRARADALRPITYWYRLPALKP